MNDTHYYTFASLLFHFITYYYISASYYLEQTESRTYGEVYRVMKIKKSVKRVATPVSLVLQRGSVSWSHS
jgi:hypothetical protein